MGYKLTVSPAARDDLDGIFEYIAKKLYAPSAAQNLIGKLEKAFLSLRDAPYRCELSRNALLADKGYRKLVVNHYIALYLVDDTAKRIIVARVFYGAMDYGKFI